MKIDNSKTIILSGGGSGGPVTPLLAVAKELAADNFNLVFVGTKTGPEKSMVASFNLPGNKKLKFISLPAGKLRRYFSLHNFSDLLRIFAAFILSFPLLRRERPSLIISAGGFVSVPLVWAARLKNIPIIIHQQDVRPGLANKLMAPAARLITVSFEKSLRDYGPKAVWIGNPIVALENQADAIKIIKEKYQLSDSKPLILVTGGATGAVALNDLIVGAKSKILEFAQIIHISGKGKLPPLPISSEPASDYQVFELLSPADVLQLMAAADLVISRCGLATLTELCELGKVAILIPIPKSQQEDNAVIFKRLNAARVLSQSELSADDLVAEIKNILSSSELRAKLSSNISKVMKRQASETMAALIKEILAAN
ncbi:MAG: UDP-N-acetylglucosamine--N-acetylmuramyl-(pentapeptide) pyrophosphoryl-undecaprenol N-acetylglucosamine transferase [Candidatus Falkowbacteria bacterium]|nr:MAG: UDP-N-acetylglucosamine--N-acetylmuramyl-(pentapeptide) pyrophosphoryl-undecaprenol N-acetylglucosamine transferase [Candidatus Falkowbacteria bacterium]